MSIIINKQMGNICNKRKYSNDDNYIRKSSKSRLDDTTRTTNDDLNDFRLKYNEIIIEINNLKQQNNSLQKQINELNTIEKNDDSTPIYIN